MRAQLVYYGDVAEIQLIAQNEGEKLVLEGIAGYKGEVRLIKGAETNYDPINGLRKDPAIFAQCQGGYLRAYSERSALVIQIDKEPPPLPLESLPEAEAGRPAKRGRKS